MFYSDASQSSCAPILSPTIHRPGLPSIAPFNIKVQVWSAGPLTILVIIGILDMEKATSVLAALDAGKFPDQNQVNQAIDWVLINGIPEIEPSGRGELSAQGKIIANGLREVLQAYKQLGSNKNGQCLLR